MAITKLFAYLIALATVFFLSGQHTLFENVVCTVALLGGMGFSPILGITYTPAIIFGPVAMSATPGTSLKTGTAGHNYIMRTINVLAPAAATGKTFTLSIGADAAATRIFDTYALATSVPAIFNGWWLVVGAGAHDIDGNCGATAVTIYAAGYDQT
jgi:hypothetical protein